MAERVQMANVFVKKCTTVLIANTNVHTIYHMLIGKVEVSIGYLWIVYVVLLLAIIGFGAGAYLLYRKVKTAPVPTQPLTVAREEERKILPVTGAFAETPEEYENQEMRWKNENLLPIEEEEKDVRELPAKEEVKEVVVAQPGEEVKDQFEQLQAEDCIQRDYDSAFE
eukprot:TRINITY_DN3494_c0_g1_i1.p10 TRINITY_DN3494_c0_g1~~TRINITY_DN3494_c0_g1_i1.p10  ORF type:complete len:168 (-),score=19.68 TRINITY_DN3494_c0_g1_i1:52-555(-)